MEEFMSQQAFTTFVIVKVIVACIIAFCFYKFARRDATAFDTIYRKRFRYAVVVFFGFCAVLSLCHVIFGAADFELPFYYRSLYGTSHPDAVTLETGLGEYTVLHGPSEICYWGRLTFEQWSLSTWIAHFILCLGLVLYFIRLQESSIKWHAKLRKFLGYVILYSFPSLINSFHYFDFGELFRFAIFVIIAYFLVRSYKRDAKPAELPKESISHPNIPEFEAIPPKEEAHPGLQKCNSSVGDEIKHDVRNCQKKIMDSLSLLWWLLGLISFFLILIWGLALLKKEEKFDCDAYRRYHVWIKPNTYVRDDGWPSAISFSKVYKCKVDPSLGNPINGEQCIDGFRVEKLSWRPIPDPCDGKSIYNEYCRVEIITYDISALGYNRSEKDRYFDYIAKCKNGEIQNDVKVGNYEKCVEYDYIEKLQSDIYIETHEPHNTVLFISHYGKAVTTCDYQNVHVQVFCDGKYAYQIKTYSLPGVDTPQLFTHLYFYNPNRHYDNSLVACAILLILLAIVLIVCFVQKIKMEKIVNKKVKVLLWYILISMVCQILFIAIYTPGMLVFDDDYELVFSAMALLYPSILFIDIPAFIYAWCKRENENSLDSLIPDWYKKHFIASCRNDVIGTKLSLVLIFYPLFYVATLPGGWFVCFYLLPMSAIFALVYFVRWIFKDGSRQNKKFVQKASKQIESTGNTLKEKLQLLKSMLDEGLITQEDYDRKKEDILRNM